MTDAPWRSTVLLRHDLPDGTWHFDWMCDEGVEPGAPGASRLLTFRVTQRIDDPACRSFTAERLPGHRWEYLTYEGELSHGRGRVARLAAGLCMVQWESQMILRVRLRFGPSERTIRGESRAGSPPEPVWHFAELSENSGANPARM